MPYDPLRIRGYHLPYCTCYDCNEARRQQGGRRRRGSGALIRLFRLLRSVTATALLCTVLIHVAVFVGILVYVGVQRGAPDGVLTMVADTFISTRQDYVKAWREVTD